MATTISPAAGTLTVTFTLSLGGKAYDLTLTRAISAITRADKRIIRVPTATETEIIGVSGTVDRGVFDTFDILILINRDDTNYVRLRLSQNANDTFDHRLDAGECFIIFNPNIEVNTTEAAFAAFVTADRVSAQANAAAVDLEYLIAQV